MKQIQIVLIYIFLLLTTSLSLHAQTTTYHVNENTLCTTGCDGLTWATAFDHLQAALDVASLNDIIWVAEGTYRPTKDINGNSTPANNRNKTFNINKDLKIYGGFSNIGNPTMADRDADAHPTVLDGDLNNNDTPGLTDTDLVNDVSRQDNAYTVVYTDGRTSACLLSGFVIQNGNANTFNGDESEFGGGMYNQSSHPSITECQFTSNSSNSRGGGILNESSNPSITNCQFTSNSAYYGGGMYNQSSHPSLTNCQFTSNSSNFGGGIYNNSSNPSLMNCQFTSNSSIGGGGIYNISSTPSITECQFTSNSSNFGGGGGGIFNFLSSLSLTNCQFTSNSANFGGGIFNFLSSSSLTNCQFTSNSANFEGGGIYNKGSSPIVTNGSFAKNSAGSGAVMYSVGDGDADPPSNPELTNCILWDNGGGSGIFDDNSFGGGTATTINYSIVQGGWTGAGNNNLNQDPQFIDADNNDLTLAPTSPAIEAGNNSADLDGSGGGTQTIAGVPFDLAGNQRIVDFDEDNTATVDMGAFEAFVAAPAPEVPTLSEWGLLNLALLLMICGTLYLVQPMREVGNEK